MFIMVQKTLQVYLTMFSLTLVTIYLGNIESTYKYEDNISRTLFSSFGNETINESDDR